MEDIRHRPHADPVYEAIAVTASPMVDREPPSSSLYGQAGDDKLIADCRCIDFIDRSRAEVYARGLP